MTTAAGSANLKQNRKRLDRARAKKDRPEHPLRGVIRDLEALLEAHADLSIRGDLEALLARLKAPAMFLPEYDPAHPERPAYGHLPPEVGAKGGMTSAAIRDGFVRPAPDEPRLVAYRRLHMKVLVLFERELDRTQRGTGAPSRDLMDLSREFRQISDRLYDLIEAEGEAAAVDEWLADLESIFEEGATKLAKALGLEPLTVPEPRSLLAAPAV